MTRLNTSSPRLLTIVGARPQFIKVAPVSRAFASRNKAGASIDDMILHTGQHYDSGMSQVFFDEMGIPAPRFNLHVGSGAQGEQTGKMLAGIEQILIDEKPDVVIIYGDTNSTLAGALAASKLHIPIAHVEAGLRSFNRTMPEEINRIVSDHVSDILLAPTKTAMTNLDDENLASKSHWTGDVMLDATEHYGKLAERSSTIADELKLADGDFAVATMHRPANTDSGRLVDVLNALNTVADKHVPVVFPVHPRTRAMMDSLNVDWQPSDNLRMIAPVGYIDMLRLLSGSAIVLTDSGGLQKEAFFVGTRCVTMRDETEWLETTVGGWNRVVGSDPAAIVTAAQAALAESAGQSSASERAAVMDDFGGGAAANRIAEEVLALAA